MKKVNFWCLMFATIMFTATSCSTKNDAITPKSIDEIVQEMSKIKVTNNNNNAVFADIEYNVKTGEILTYKIAERELDIVWIPTRSEKVLNTRGNSYKITCSEAVYKDSNGRPSKETSCDSSYGCGTKMKTCLDGGGCATICKALIIRVPAIENVRDEELMIALGE